MLDPLVILEKYSAPVPRYTSYPAAPHFQAELGKHLVTKMLALSNSDEPVSIYIHIPFCDRLCWFCGCHTKQTKKYAPVKAYVDALLGEMNLIAARLDCRPNVAHLHFGGGSPSLLSSEDFSKISNALRKMFVIDADTEISVEIDPNDSTTQLLEGLKILGITRASIGVQDFDADVQAAINRPQTFAQTSELVKALRVAGVSSVNIDALYGLPLQDINKIRSTIEQVINLMPDRVALFGYAHVPWLKKHQRMIRNEDLPGSIERFEQALTAEQALLSAGYEKIGIDHYAKKADALAIAARRKTLHRNFQGYTTDNCSQLFGFGASSIGRFRDGYIQNLVPTGQYQTAIGQGILPAMKGYALTRDDRIRGSIIEQLMCQFAVSISGLEEEFGATALPYINEMKAVAADELDGLCKITGDQFSIPHEAQAFTRIVAARFDAHLRESKFQYSKAV